MANAASTLQTRPRPDWLKPWLRGETWAAFLFILPSLIGFTLFYAVPAVRGLLISFTDWDLLTPAEPVGLGNYQRLIRDRDFWHALWVTFVYVVINVSTQTVFGLTIAVFMDRLTRSVLVRGIMILPFLFSNVVVGLIWLWILDPSLGIANELLKAVGLPRQPFLGSPDQAIATIAGINIWRTGYMALPSWRAAIYPEGCLRGGATRHGRCAALDTRAAAAPRSGLCAGDDHHRRLPISRHDRHYDRRRPTTPRA